MDINSTQFAAFSSFKNTVETYVGDLCQTHGWNWRATRRSRGQPARCGLGKSTVVAVALGIQGTHHHTRSCKIIQVNRCHIVSCHLILQVSYHGDSAKCCSAQSRVFELDWTGKANPLKHVRLRSVSSETNVVTHMSGPHSECLSHRLKIGLIAGRELARQLVKIRASCVDSKVWLLKSTWQHRFFLKCQHCYESQGGHQNRSRPGVLPLVEVWGPKKFNLGVLGRWSKHGGWMISQGGGAGASGAKRRNLRCIFWMFPPHNFFVVFVVVELDSVLKERTWLISHSASWRYACACPCATSPWLLSACTGNCRNGPGSQMFTDVHRWFKQCSAQRSRFFRSWMGVDLKLQSQCHEMSSDQSHWMMSVETYLRSHVVVSTARSRAPGISWSFFYLLQHATRYFMILMKYSDIYIYMYVYTYVYDFYVSVYFDYFITQNKFWKVWYLPEFGMWKNPLFQLSVEVLILLRSYPALSVWSDVGAWVLWRARRVTYLRWHTRKIRRILDLTCDLLPVFLQCLPVLQLALELYEGSMSSGAWIVLSGPFWEIRYMPIESGSIMSTSMTNLIRETIWHHRWCGFFRRIYYTHDHIDKTGPWFQIL